MNPGLCVRFPSPRARLSYQTVGGPWLTGRSRAEIEEARGTCGNRRGAVRGEVRRRGARRGGAHAVLQRAGSPRTWSPVCAQSVVVLGVPLTSPESPFLHLQRQCWRAELLWRLNETPRVDSILPFQPHLPFPSLRAAGGIHRLGKSLTVQKLY